MRPPTACTGCRDRRRKCAITRPGSPCTFCKRRKVHCSLTTVAEFQSGHSGIGESSPISLNGIERTSSDSTLGELEPPPRLCEELVNLYFRYIHDTFHSLFHQPSLLEDVRRRTIPRVILLSIISLSCRFSQDPFFDGVDPRLRGRPYAEQAAQLLDLRDVSVNTIQACVVLGAFVITEGEAVPESLYYSVACRLAMLIDLPGMPTSTRLEQETNIRIWWTLGMIDVWSSNGVRLPRSITPRHDVPWPIQEVVFLNMRREDLDPPSPTATQESEASLLAQMVKLNAILFEISKLNHIVISDTSNPQFTAFEFDASVETLDQRLEDWYANVPPQLKDTPENLEHYASLGLGHFFLAVYLGYYHFGQLLYYQYLDENIFANDTVHNDLPSTDAARYAARCKLHSTALCEILYRAYSTPGCEVYYTMVGHVLVIASTVQLYILLFSSSEPDISAARERLERNFEILAKLQTYWPTLDVCFTRFREFHNACLDEKKREKSFRMDRWMLQFLFEFAKPVTEREVGTSWRNRPQ